MGIGDKGVGEVLSGLSDCALIGQYGLLCPASHGVNIHPVSPSFLIDQPYFKTDRMHPQSSRGDLNRAHPWASP